VAFAQERITTPVRVNGKMNDRKMNDELSAAGGLDDDDHEEVVLYAPFRRARRAKSTR
jgi:hypothetical protein